MQHEKLITISALVLLWTLTGCSSNSNSADSNSEVTLATTPDSTNSLATSSDDTPSSNLNPTDDDNQDNLLSASLVNNGYMLVRNERLRANGTVYNLSVFEYDIVNNQITQSISSSNGLDDLNAYATYTYNESGNLTYVNILREFEFLAVKFEFIYGVAGNLEEFNSYGLDGNRIEQFVFSYYPDGRINQKIDSDQYGEKIITANYDEDNRLESTTGSSEFYPSAPRISHISFGHENGTDDFRAETFKESGESATGYSLHQFDDAGNLVRVDWFRVDGTPWFSDRYVYEPAPEPVFNYWTLTLRYFPEHVRFPVGSW